MALGEVPELWATFLSLTFRCTCEHPGILLQLQKEMGDLDQKKPLILAQDCLASRYPHLQESKVPLKVCWTAQSRLASPRWSCGGLPSRSICPRSPCLDCSPAPAVEGAGIRTAGAPDPHHPFHSQQ